MSDFHSGENQASTPPAIAALDKAGARSSNRARAGIRMGASQ
jgi:tRNA U55 pseudouridine synthase TruB